MKKILINIVLLFFITSNVNAHISHYKNFKKIEMEIFLNNKLIGYNYYFFKIDKDITLITNQIKFTVKVLGATIFEVEGYGEEKYNKNKLISFNSRTKQNKKEKFVNLKLDKKNDEFISPVVTFPTSISSFLMKMYVSMRVLIHRKLEEFWSNNPKSHIFGSSLVCIFFILWD